MKGCEETPIATVVSCTPLGLPLRQLTSGTNTTYVWTAYVWKMFFELLCFHAPQ